MNLRRPGTDPRQQELAEALELRWTELQQQCGGTQRGSAVAEWSGNGGAWHGAARGSTAWRCDGSGSARDAATVVLRTARSCYGGFFLYDL